MVFDVARQLSSPEPLDTGAALSSPPSVAARHVAGGATASLPVGGHRHAAAARRALARIRLLTDPEATSDPDWTHYGSRSGVSIYSRIGLPDIDARLHDGAPVEPETHEALPCFRGDGYLPGAAWQLDDLIATIASLGARTVWDQARFRGDSSKVVQSLSSSDFLAHVYVRGTDLVGERDSSQVITCVRDETNADLGFIASCSVVDPLIPLTSHTRAHLNVAGWRLERVERPRRPPSPPAPASPTSAVARPYMPRSSSLIQPGLQSPDLSKPISRALTMPEPPPHDLPLAPLRQRPLKLSLVTPERRASIATVTPETDVEPTDGPGVMLSYALMTTPHGTIPVSFTNRLTQAAPTCIASLVRYLQKYGFAPHIDRRDREQVDVLTDRFDALAGTYHLLFRRRADQCTHNNTRIRFHGASFSNGRFDVTVERAKAWIVEYDSAPDASSLPETASGEGEIMCSMPPPGRPRITQRFSSAYVPRTASTLPTPLSPTSPASPNSDDPTTRPGSQGGCTLVVYHHANPMPVEVRIVKRPERAGVRSQAMVERGAAFSAIAKHVDTAPIGHGHSAHERAHKALAHAKDALHLLRRRDVIRLVYSLSV